MKITIEYCAQWNYKPRASSLGKQLEEKLGAEVGLISGSGGVFEVHADGKSVFSKKELNRFPYEGEIISLLSK